jgi:hypothetical protein
MGGKLRSCSYLQLAEFCAASRDRFFQPSYQNKAHTLVPRGLERPISRNGTATSQFDNFPRRKLEISTGVYKRSRRADFAFRVATSVMLLRLVMNRISASKTEYFPSRFRLAPPESRSRVWWHNSRGCGWLRRDRGIKCKI